LYQEQEQLPFLEFEDIRKLEPLKLRKKYQDKISWADKIVFIHPMWWYIMPAILKNFIDQVFTSGFANSIPISYPRDF